MQPLHTEATHPHSNINHQTKAMQYISSENMKNPVPFFGCDTSPDTWDIRSIYDKPNPDPLEQAAFFSTFAQFRDINGHRIQCILTRPKYQHLRVTLYGGELGSGLSGVDAVLVVRLVDVSGMRQGESLRVDGQVYVIQGISYPLHDIARLELSGVQG